MHKRGTGIRRHTGRAAGDGTPPRHNVRSRKEDMVVSFRLRKLVCRSADDRAVASRHQLPNAPMHPAGRTVRLSPASPGYSSQRTAMPALRRAAANSPSPSTRVREKVPS